MIKPDMSPMKLRTLNRYTLHPKNQCACDTCLNIFTDIKTNFLIKRYHGDVPSYETVFLLLRGEIPRRVLKEAVFRINN